MDGQPVVVNLEGIDIMEAQRIMDFISGCIFSISGNMRQVSVTYLCFHLKILIYQAIILKIWLREMDLISRR